jgi:signal transduction histidine kinase
VDLRLGAKRYGDVAIAVVLAVLLVIDVVRWDFGDRAILVPAALLATLPLSMRRRAPLIGFVLSASGLTTVIGLTIEFDSTTPAVVAAFTLTLYSAGRHTRGLEAWVAFALVLAGTVGFLVEDGEINWQPGAVAFALVFVAGPFAAGVAVRLRTDREQALLVRNAQLHREQEERSRAAVTAERARIARELHDVVSHAISVTVLQARGGRRMLGVDDQEVRKALDAIEHVNTQALGDMRRLLFLLRSVDDDEHRPDPSPSLARLETLIGQVRDSGLSVELSMTGATEKVPPGVDSSAYRIIQEALTNALKHAGPAAHAHVDVDCGEAGLTVAVRDDGRSRGIVAGRGHGLIGIRERVAVVGGQLTIGPGKDGGFVVQATLPYAVETS